MRKTRGRGAARQFAEKLDLSTPGAKALIEKKGLIAALKALRHPKASLSYALGQRRQGRRI
jgi:hypothetical protein